MKALPLILIAGWGHTCEAMLRLKEALDGYPIQVTSTGELWQTQSSGALPRAPGSAKDSTCVVPADGRSRLPRGFLRRQGYAGQVPRGASRYAMGLHNLLATFGGRVGVIGWSMGGIVALETAREYPGLLQRLVIISGTARFSAGNDEPPGVSAAVLRAMALGLQRTPDNVLAAYYAKVHAPQGGSVAADATRNLAIAQLDRSEAPRGKPREVIAESCEASAIPPCGKPQSFLAKKDELLQGLDYLQRMDVRNGLDKQTVPTLVVHGREDRIVPWQAGEWLSCALAVSHWRCHEGLGHALPIQAPLLLAADIRAFLA